jgi:hypothetical protein
VADGFGELIAMHLTSSAPPLRMWEPDIDPKLEAVVLRALEKDPPARWQSMAELGRALGGAVEGAVVTGPVGAMTGPGAEAALAMPAPRGPAAPGAPTAAIGPSAHAATLPSSPGMAARPPDAMRRSTLSASAVELRAPAARGRWRPALVAAAAVAALGGAAGLGAWLLGGEDEEDATIAAVTKLPHERTKPAESTATETAAATAAATAATGTAAATAAAGTAAGTDAMTARPTAKGPRTAAPKIAAARPGTAAYDEVVGAALRAAKGRIAGCAGAAATTVTVRFEIDAAGAPVRVAAEPPHAGSDEGLCVAAVVASLRFAKPDAAPWPVRRAFRLKGGSDDGDAPIR